MNTKLLESVMDQITKHPESLEMRSCGNFCGTTHCIAGWAIALDRKANDRRPFYLNGLADDESSQEGRKALNLNHYQADMLFHVSNWPKEFHDIHDAAFTKEEKSKITCDRIRHFIATEGAE